MKFNLGARYDDHEQYGSEINPRLGAIYTVNSKINLHASAGKAYTPPTYTQLYYKGWGEPNLKPEIAKAYETGIRYLNQGFKGEFNLFKRDVEDMIGFNDKYEYENIDSAEIKGAELILDKQLTDKLSTNFNYTYLDARDENTDELLEYRPYHRANISLDYDNKDFNVNLTGEFTGEREYVDRYANYPYPRKEQPSHFVVDLKLSRVLNNNAKVSLEVNNLLDREYQYWDGYTMPKRNVMINLSREF